MHQYAHLRWIAAYRPVAARCLLTLAALGGGCDAYPLPLVKFGLQAERSKAGLAQSFVSIEPGMEICVADSRKTLGADPIPVVGLHGFSTAKESLLHLARMIAPERRMILIDLPGHGLSDCAADARYGIRDQAACVQRVLQEMQIARCHLIGHSMGGAVAVELVARDPDRVVSLALIAPLGMPDPLAPSFKALQNGSPPMNPLIRDERWPAHRAIRFAVGESPERNPFNPKWVEQSIRSAAALAERRTCRTSFAEIFAQFDGYSMAWSVLEEIRQPTLILWGAQDRILDPRGAQWFAAQLPSAIKPSGVPLPGIGHLVPLEAVTTASTLYRDFLNHVR